ncbi:MAG: hypothetical protein BWY82_02680 [Verrucomicrobia bacterium ADurb.Bin474]|nr:MAG: hypothetical protein BWY82_02680 [Verrucomicrobia bacterium ADurb.Bin474]
MQAGIVSDIDTGDHDIGLPRKQMGQRYVHTIGGSSVNHPAIAWETRILSHRDIPVPTDRFSDPALLTQRNSRTHVIVFAKRINEDPHERGIISIVIGHQYKRPITHASGFFSTSLTS